MTSILRGAALFTTTCTAMLATTLLTLNAHARVNCRAYFGTPQLIGRTSHAWEAPYAAFMDGNVRQIRALDRSVAIRLNRPTGGGGLQFVADLSGPVEAIEFAAFLASLARRTPDGSRGYLLNPAYRFDQTRPEWPISIYLGDTERELWNIVIQTIAKPGGGIQATVRVTAPNEIAALISENLLSQFGLVGHAQERTGGLNVASVLASLSLGPVRRPDPGRPAVEMAESLAVALGLYLDHGFEHRFYEGIDPRSYLLQRIGIAERPPDGGQTIEQIPLALIRAIFHARGRDVQLGSRSVSEGMMRALQAANSLRENPREVARDARLAGDFLFWLSTSALHRLLPHNSAYYNGTPGSVRGVVHVTPIQAELLDPTRYNYSSYTGEIVTEPEGYARAPFLRFRNHRLYRHDEQLRSGVIGRPCIYYAYRNGRTYVIRGVIQAQFGRSWNDGVVIRLPSEINVIIPGPLVREHPILFLKNDHDEFEREP